MLYSRFHSRLIRLVSKTSRGLQESRVTRDCVTRFCHEIRWVSWRSHQQDLPDGSNPLPYDNKSILFLSLILVKDQVRARYPFSRDLSMLRHYTKYGNFTPPSHLETKGFNEGPILIDS